MALTDLQESIIIDLRVHGTDKPGNIGNRIGRPRSSVSRVLPDLIEGKYVENKGSGVYRLTDKGRERAQSLIRERIDLY